MVVNTDSVPSVGPQTADPESRPVRPRLAAGWRLHWFPLALAGIVTGALALRVVGVAWGLPYGYHPDEPVTVNVAHDMLLHHTLNPHFFDWGSMSFDIQAVVHVAYVLVGEALGRFGSASDVGMPVLVGGTIVIGNPSVLLAARLVSVVLGVALVLVGAWLTWLVSHRRSAVLVAAALIAINPILVRNARWATPDTTAGLMATLTIVGAVLIAHEPSRGHYVFAGVAVGLSVASKYNTVLLSRR